MAEINGKNAFVLGANIREDLEKITKTERMVRNGGYRHSLPSFEDLQKRHQHFQYFYNSPAGAEPKIRV